MPALLPLLPAVTSTVGTYLSESELPLYNHFGYNPCTHLQHSGPGLTFLLLTGFLLQPTVQIQTE